MKNAIQNNKYLFLLLAIVLAGAAFLFRASISDLLVIREKKNQNTLGPGGEENAVGRSSSSTPEIIPPYTGRDPGEFRPDPKETASFGKSDLDSFNSQIQMNARAVKEHPDFLEGWLELGLFKKILGDYEGARDAWEYAGVIRPFNSVSFANLGELYWKYIPDYPKSEKNFLISIQNKPDDIATYMSLSDLYSYSYVQKKDQADDVLLRGLEANKGNADLMKWLASLYEREKEYSKALEWWKKALAQNPSDTLVKDAIAELEKKGVK